MKKTANKVKFTIPEEVSRITEGLKKAGFEAYIVGGCVRDLFLKKTPKDWDITTNAKPEEIMALFEETFYENNYGTVGIVNKDTKDKTFAVVEVTPYRLEAIYSDNRRPDYVTFSDKIENDLERRDFTINAIAYSPSKSSVVDLHGGEEDLKNKIIRTVGEAEKRFNEDGLRILRAIRLHAELDFTINIETESALKKTAPLLEKISKERIRDEFIRIIMSDNPVNALILSHELGILKYVVPELEKGIGIEQNQAHSYDVWTHNLKTLQHSVDKKWGLTMRLSALFHDIAKPHVREWSEEKKDWTFYGHDVVGSRLTEKMLKELRFSKDIIENVSKLVRWHMFFSDTDQITLSAVRRLVARVGKENVWDLMNLRMCDRIGTGRPKENPYRLRKYKAMIEEVMADPISVGMLKINGNILIEKLKLLPGPKIGFILHALLEEVIEDPSLNKEDILENKANKLAILSDEELKKIGEQGKVKKEGEQEKKIQEIRGKYWVK
ncbi:MAG: CCA tRNA nucleotidyltransferase [Patescibacteria group bacterium]